MHAGVLRRVITNEAHTSDGDHVLDHLVSGPVYRTVVQIQPRKLCNYIMQIVRLVPPVTIAKLLLSVQAVVLFFLFRLHCSYPAT